MPQPVWLHLATRSQFDLQMALKSSPNDLKMIGFFLFLYLFLFLFLSLFLFLFLVIFFFLIIRFLQLDLQMPPKSSNNDSQMISKMISKASPPNYPEQFIQNRITESPNLRIPEFPPLPSIHFLSWVPSTMFVKQRLKPKRCLRSRAGVIEYIYLSLRLVRK